MQTRSKTVTPSTTKNKTATTTNDDGIILDGEWSPIPSERSPTEGSRRKRNHIRMTPQQLSGSDYPANSKTKEYPGSSRVKGTGKSNNDYGQRISTPNNQKTTNIITSATTTTTIPEQQNSPAAGECSLTSLSFLNAVEDLERKHAPLINCHTTPGRDGTSNNNNNNDSPLEKNEECKTKRDQSPNLFAESFNAEDLELLDMIPASQYQITPKSNKLKTRAPQAHHYQNKNENHGQSSNSRNNQNNLQNGIKPAQSLPSSSSTNPSVVVDDKVKDVKKKPTKTKGKKKGAQQQTNVKPKKKAYRNFKVAYTNRKATKALSESATNELSRDEIYSYNDEEKLNLTSWGLPQSIVWKYQAKGLTQLFQWQLDCLANEKVLEGRNLVYSAPTSAGKTLVAEILMVKRVLELGKKAIMILPFVSVAREKMYALQDIFGDSGIRVEGFMGSYNPPGGFKSVDIAVCTIEKANSLINRLLEENELSKVGTIVVDEMHLIGDPHRGYLLELLLTKIKFMMSKNPVNNPNTQTEHGNSQSIDESTNKTRLNIQIIGMSATLPNLNLLANWLDAELYITEFRPVPLVESIKLGDKILDANLEEIRKVKSDSLQIDIEGDDDHVVYLSLETVLDGHSVLIFCPFKQWCESSAAQIANAFRDIGHPDSKLAPEIGAKLRTQLNTNHIKELVNQLKQCPAGLDKALGRAVAFGVGFHHAGLTFDERDIIESAFKKGILRVIIATSTLSAGVNLPARRVIIRSPTVFGNKPLDVLTYRQMSGRAGRKGVDSQGESILICDKNKTAGVGIIQATLPLVKSALLREGGTLTSSMKRALLEVIASEITKTPADVQNYFLCTLLSLTIDLDKSLDKELPASQENHARTINECLHFLEENDFIRLNKFENNDRPDEYMATQLGSACLSSSLSPDEGIIIYKELQKARQRFVLTTELHVIYQVTPIYLQEQWSNISWIQYSQLLGKLSDDELIVSNLVGVNENFVIYMMNGGKPKKEPQLASLAVHQRFYIALALNDLVNEVPITDVAEKYGINKGVVQNLQQSASTFAGMVTAFCSRLGWSNLELLLSQFQERLEFGVQRELCDLVRLGNMNGQRARILYDAGIKSVLDLAAADPVSVEKILHRAGPFNSTVHGDGGNHTIWMLGKAKTEREAAQILVNEARQFLHIVLGLDSNVAFGQPPSNAKTASQEPQNMQNVLKSVLSQSISQRKLEISITAPIATTVNEQDADFHYSTGHHEGREEEEEDGMKENSNLSTNNNDSDVEEIQVIDVEEQDNSIKSFNDNDSDDNDSSSTCNDVHIITLIDCESENSTTTTVNSADFELRKKINTKNNNQVVSLNNHSDDKPSSSSSSRRPGTSKEHDEMNKALNTTSWLHGLSSNKVENQRFHDQSKNINDGNKKDNSNKNNAKGIGEEKVSKGQEAHKGQDVVLVDEYDINGVFDDSFTVFNTQENHVNLAINEAKILESQTQTQNDIIVIEDDTQDSHKISTSKKTSTTIKSSNSHMNSNKNIIKTTTKEVNNNDNNNKDLIINSSAKHDNSNNIGSKNITSSKVQNYKSVSSSSSNSINRKKKENSNNNTESVRRLLEESHVNYKKRMSKFEENFNDPDVLNLLLDGTTFISDQNNTSIQKQQHHKSSTTTTSSISATTKNDNDCEIIEITSTKVSTTKIDEEDEAFSEPLFESSQEFEAMMEIEQQLMNKNINPKPVEAKDAINGKKNSDSVVSLMSISLKESHKNVGTSSKYSSTSSRNMNKIPSLKEAKKRKLSVVPEGRSTIKKKEASDDELFEKSNSDSSSVADSNEIFEDSSVEEEEEEYEQEVIKPIPLLLEDDDENKDGSQDMFLEEDNTNKLPEPHPKFQSLFVQGKPPIVPRIIHSLDELPSNFFKCNQSISLDIKISSASKQQGKSSTKHINGIGSKIISKQKTTAKQETNFVKYRHSITLYNGDQSNTIWKFKWDIEKPEDDSKTKRKEILQNLFAKIQKSKCSIIFIDAKDKLKQLLKFAGNNIIVNTWKKIHDPKIAQWLWTCESSDEPVFDCYFTIDYLIQQHFNSDEQKVQSMNWSSEIKQVFIGWVLMDKLKIKLKEKQLWKHFIDTEMPSIFPLLMMELNGFGINTKELQRLKKILQFKEALLELKAFEIAGRKFNFSSSKEISTVLFQTLGLTRPPNTKGTSKEVLSQIDHEVAKIILEWRKISGALHKVVIPFQQGHNNLIHTARVRGNYSHFTLTGRLVMSEPSIQCVPRDFDLQIIFSISEIEDIKRKCQIKFGSEFQSILNTINNGIRDQLLDDANRLSVSSDTLEPTMCISMRNVFTSCSSEFILLSGDYSQLELRILAHLCKDKKLLQALNSDGDVFKSIASKWKNISISQVTNECRQEAKAITYGIIYGMGSKSLSQKMDVTKATAEKFICDFMRAYPRIRTFVDETKQSCRDQGYIETICGRKRYIPNINSNQPSLRAQAERQAVNSKIQGSAADLVKKAMVGIQAQLEVKYPETRIPVDWILKSENSSKKYMPTYDINHRHSTSKTAADLNDKKVPYFPILNLHDELIYEVHKTELDEIAKLIRKTMESSLPLKVKLPVVIKIGSAWGTLHPYHE